MKKIFSLFAAVLFAGSMMATQYISYYDETQDEATTITTANVSNGTAGKISWVGTSCSWGSNRVNIAINGSIKFTADENYKVTKVVIVSGSSADYYGTWTATSGDVASSSGTTTVSNINAQEVTVTTSTAFRCTNAQSIKIYYTDAAAPTVVAKPKFTLAAGSYEGAQSVEITCATEGATIYYTTDGTAPTTTSNVYSAAIEVSKTTTIKAFAAKTGLDNSDVVEATYTIFAVADVILDFTDNTEWNIPVGTTKTTGENSYSDGTYTVKLYGPTGNGYYYDSEVNNIMIGKSGAYILLPKFADKAIARVATVGVEGGSGSVTFNVYNGDNAVSTEVTSCKVDQAFDISPKKVNKEYMIKITNNNNARFSKIKIWFGEPDPDTREVVSAVSFTGFEGYFKVGMTWDNDAMTALYNRIQPGEGTGDWWQKSMQNLSKWNEATEQYEYVDYYPGTVLTAGKYFFAAQIKIEGEEAQTKRLPKAGEPTLQVTVDGKTWPHENSPMVTDDYSYDWIVSPEFTLTDTGTGVEDVMSGKVSTKVLRDGVLIIERDGVRYNVLGEIVR